jgi:hypothetical protein
MTAARTTPAPSQTAQNGTGSMKFVPPAPTGRWPKITETCDRCGPAVGAGYRVNRAGELYLCGQRASRHWRALSAQGWSFWPLGVHALAPQARAASRDGPIQDAA